MAKFRNKLWTDSPGDAKQQLLVATLLWLRTVDAVPTPDLGYVNLIKLIVQPDNDLFFGHELRDFPDNRLVVSDGTVYQIYGLKHRFTWVETNFAPINMWGIQLVARESRVHFKWLEWALAHAMVQLADAGIDWFPKPKPQTIGGLEVADFSDL